ncbi:exonuclease SbcCD subunit D [Paenibacillus sp. GCM10027627]|uniref:metallophosphoesterase family protein n=1 Tax=unclassified Paenibacillus TaxID=185978 RepID=UPI0036402924
MSVSFRFIHAADLHLDSPFRGLAKAPEIVRKGLADATFAALNRLTDMAILQRVDFIVIAGDLFDEADRSLKAQIALVKEWERLAAAGIAVFAIHGNHDHLGGRRARLELPPSVHIFGAAEVSSCPAFTKSGELAAYIYGVSYGERAVSRNLAAEYITSPGGPYHIALLHGNVGGHPSHDPYAPCTLEELVKSGFQYWALGHIHKREVLHEYPHVVYSGNLQGRHPKETGAKGCYLVDVDRSGATKLRFCPLDTIRWEEETISIDGIETEQQLLRHMDRAVALRLQAEEGCSVMLRIRLVGRGALHEALRQTATITALLEGLQLEHELAEGRNWIFVYELLTETGAEIDWVGLAGEESFTGELLRMSYKLEQDEEAWRGFAREALQDAIEHARAGLIGREKWEELPERWLEQARELTISLLAKEEHTGRRP